MNVNILLIIIFSIVVVSLLILIYSLYLYNKINYSIIRLDEANKRIDSNLKDKYELLNRSVSLIKEKIKDEKIFKEIIKLRSRKVSNNTLNEILNDSYLEFNKLLNDNKNLSKSEELVKIKKQLIAIDSELDTLKSYYNSNVSYYNKLIRSFPTFIVAKIKKYKNRDFFDYKEEK